jgi:hypothetical protein
MARRREAATLLELVTVWRSLQHTYREQRCISCLPEFERRQKIATKEGGDRGPEILDGYMRRWLPSKE